MSECMTQEDAMNMSNEQAIQILKPLRDMMIDQHGCPVSDDVFALDKAIEVLSQHQPERKTGKWIDMGDFEQCSVCLGTRLKELQTFYGKAIWIKTDFCPNCGARMSE